MMVTVMMVSMLRKIWRMERPSMTLMSLKKYCLVASILLFLLLADDCEKDLLQAWLFFNILHLCGREQLFQVCERAIGDNPALMQNGNLIGKLFRFLQILRGQEYRRAIIGKLFDSLPNLDARLGVKPGGRLVEENDLRFSYQAHGDVEPAAHTSRISRHPAVGGIGQA